MDVAQLTLDQISYETDIFIDVRSPDEFAEYSLPRAINIPIFTNEERAIVGTTFKQQSREAAMKVGLSIFAPKWPDVVRQVTSLQTENRRIIIYCWRGGMRSKTIAATLGLMNIPCYQLVGGIRSFRRNIQHRLAEESKKEREFIVIAGHTGTRKTEFLEELQTNGFPVLDLERLAGHRGSIFGHIGMIPNSQKQFDYLLLCRLEELKDHKTVIIEAESKRIGHVVLPDFIIEGKQRGTRVELVYPFWKRVDHIHRTYQPEKNAEHIWEAIEYLRKRLSKQVYDEVKECWETQNYKQVFALLLEYYYDPRYKHAFQKYSEASCMVEFTTFQEGLEKVITLLHERTEKTS
ncbi:tRNA 2-selenouridine(34) synthase MnmH [Bacillus solitudinis]|uniref:tRNA 2-selenouridine(34) synthase MnmH n=1 Tax=Bacillus solitudinis TaxID=2014074 RepID=UPI001D0D16E0|nr:tRNA 2-selenouridine(34) synthase MnmH [Bacillus solitudinis]